jgi:hypothetical protein
MIPGIRSRIPVEDIAVGARFLFKLPGFLRRRVGPEEARRILRRRLGRREADFLAHARLAIYEHGASPYRPLLQAAGCEYGDLAQLVQQEGLEGALRALYLRGVYLSVEEFKGQKEVVRGSTRLTMEFDGFHNPIATTEILRYRSGSRGPRTPVPVNFASLRDRVVNVGLSLHARGGIGWQHAIWEVPGGVAMINILEANAADAPPVRWFSQVDPVAAGLHARYLWSARLMCWVGKLVGVSLPAPQYVSLDDPLPIARWMVDVLRAGGTPHLKTYASSAVRLSLAAQANGLDLRGAQLTVSGEPVTPARLAKIRQSGATAVPRCGTSEAGLLGYGCLAPEVSDELHVYNDMNVLIQPGPDDDRQPLPPRSILLSSLRPTARLILLNVSLGDQAELGTRTCGCPLEALGWTLHLHTLRSYEKLTSGGMTFLDSDVIRVLEEVLPARCGGGPTDYQLLEEAAVGGEPRLRLLVHPRLGELDPETVVDTFLSALGGGHGVERVMEMQWREGGYLVVDRQPPRITPSGKILHLHQERPLTQS